MLDAARERRPDAKLWQADMTTFTVGAPVDALLCLFSSIGYLEPERALPAAAARFAAAVRPGGALIIEPWIAPDVFEPGRQMMQTYDGDDVKLCRMVAAERDGDQAIFDFHWLIMEAGRPVIRHVVDRHVVWLVPRDQMLAVFDAAGFDARWEPDGLMRDRELLIGRRRC
jgi:daunosaminyl-N,N-dimethyltransferase/N-dimethyltransferase